MSIALYITNGVERGKNFALLDSKVTIGRDLSNTVPIADEEISRFHCTLVIDADSITLVDLGSSNGTFVNGERVSRRVLSMGDRLQLGQTRFLLSEEGLQVSQIEDEETGIINQQSQDTCQIHHTSMTLRADEEEVFRASDDEESFYEVIDPSLDEKRQFIQLRNDLRFVYQTTLATTRKHGVMEVLDELLDLVFNWVAADRGCVFLANEDSDSFSIRLVKSESLGVVDNFNVCRPLVDHVIQQKVGVLSADPMDSLRQSTSPGLSEISEIMCVPIQARGELLGVFYVDTLVNSASRKTQRFTKDHLRLMLSMAHQAATYIESEYYYATLIEREKHAAVGETTALLSHQINNIIQGINGGGHLLEMGLGQAKSELIEQGWEIVKRNQARISNMMLDLVFLSKSYSPDPGNCDLDACIATSIESVSSEEDFQSIKFKYEPQKISVNEIDPEGVLGIIRNLLALAARACRRDEVRVETRLENKNLIVDFRYFGAEIYSRKDEESNVIHDPNMRQFGGLELAIARKLVDGHNGSITLETRSFANNSISVSLPVHSAE